MCLYESLKEEEKKKKKETYSNKSFCCNSQIVAINLYCDKKTLLPTIAIKSVTIDYCNKNLVAIEFCFNKFVAINYYYY